MFHNFHFYFFNSWTSLNYFKHPSTLYLFLSLISNFISYCQIMWSVSHQCYISYKLSYALNKRSVSLKISLVIENIPDAVIIGCKVIFPLSVLLIVSTSILSVNFYLFVTSEVCWNFPLYWRLSISAYSKNLFLIGF